MLVHYICVKTWLVAFRSLFFGLPLQERIISISLEKLRMFFPDSWKLTPTTLFTTTRCTDDLLLKTHLIQEQSMASTCSQLKFDLISLNYQYAKSQQEVEPIVETLAGSWYINFEPSMGTSKSFFVNLSKQNLQFTCSFKFDLIPRYRHKVIQMGGVSQEA